MSRDVLTKKQLEEQLERRRAALAWLRENNRGQKEIDEMRKLVKLSETRLERLEHAAHKEETASVQEMGK